MGSTTLSLNDLETLDRLIGVIQRLSESEYNNQIANRANISSRTLDRWKKRESLPSFVPVVRLLKELGTSLDELGYIFGIENRNKEENDPDGSYDFSDYHKKCLQLYSGMKYYCFYCDPESVFNRTNNNKINGYVQPVFCELIIETCDHINRNDGYLKGILKYSGYVYTCKFVVPNRSKYLYIYASGSTERPFIALPFRHAKFIDNRNVRRIQADVGVMLHFLKAIHHEPCYQRILFVGEDIVDKFRNMNKARICNKYLRQNLSEGALDDKKLLIAKSDEQLEQISNNFFRELVPKSKKNK